MTEKEKQKFLDHFHSVMMDTTEAAEKLGHKTTGAINSFIARGQLRTIKLGKRDLFIFRDEFAEWAANRPGKGGRPKKGTE